VCSGIDHIRLEGVSAKKFRQHIARNDACYKDSSVRDRERHTLQRNAGENYTSTGGFGSWTFTTLEPDDVIVPAPQAVSARVAIHRVDELWGRSK